jgi:hypothetical protein
MDKKYRDITKHLDSLEDHGHLYMYYGVPHSEECLEYGDYNADGKLILSYECDDLCWAIAEEFEDKFEWLDILRDNKIKLEEVFDLDVETLGFDVTASLLLYLVASLILEDKFIDALGNGYLIRLIKRLQCLS